MSETNRTPRDAERRNDPESEEAAAAVPPVGTPPFDWQVLLLRYLPQPAGSSHLIKRLAPR